MKKRMLLFAPCLLGIIFFLSGCVKDTVKQTYTYTLYRPVYKTTAAVRADIKSSAPVDVQQPGKLFVRGHFIFLNEVDKGVHIIDNSDPAQPKNVAFIDIPGNVDLAVKGNTLYADLYTDLVAIDISDPLAAHVTRIVENVFPHRYYNYYNSMDSSQVVVNWIVKDTTVTETLETKGWQRIGRGGVIMYPSCPNCDVMFASAVTPGAKASSPVGLSGSMARFTIINNRLYTVGVSELDVFNISNDAEPAFVSTTPIGFNIETIYPFKDKLFVGSTNGMFVYSIANPDQPSQLSQYAHVQSCDPVIAEDDYAYVTLRSGTTCNGFTNQLEVLNIGNVLQPFMVKTYAMTHPTGLCKDGNLLFICDDTDGLKVYDAAKPDALLLLQTITGLEPYDVIAYNDLAIVVAKDGLYQFDYSNHSNIRQLSKLTLH